MFINKVRIKNFRCFDNFETILNQLTIIIGENNSGKTNFIKALSLPLSLGSLDSSPKRLSVSDFNSISVSKFLSQAHYFFRLDDKNPKLQEEYTNLHSLIPIIEVTLEFSGPKNNFEKSLISSFLEEDDSTPTFKIKYIYYPRDDLELLEKIKNLVLSIPDKDDLKWHLFPIDNYDYDIVTTSNNKSVSFDKLKNLVINTIGAERDDFSDSQTMRSNNILTKLLIAELNDNEKQTINSAYNTFFAEVEKANTFKRILNSDESFENIKEHLKDVGCIPNLPNLKNILSNITLSYGQEFLYQKGLGERNLVFIFLFFAYFKSTNKEFNLCCVEEPEAHLGVNKLRSTIDFIQKSISESNGLLQTIVTTHNPSIINKLKIDNVIAFSGSNAVSLSSFGAELNDYLRKRPNFDILKLIYADKIILVEGPSEEILIRTYTYLDKKNLSDIEVISVNHKGYRSFLDIWLLVNKNNANKKIGVIRDFDDQPTAQAEHDKYRDRHPNLCVETTILYTLEDDLVNHGDNLSNIAKYYSLPKEHIAISDHLKDDKTGGMLMLCDSMVDEKNPLLIEPPQHIKNILEAMK